MSFEAISPLDGRYRSQLEDLAPLVSEEALMRQRAEIQAAWLLFLAEIPALAPKIGLSQSQRLKIKALVSGDEPIATLRIKELEGVTRHDLKAVEYYLAESFASWGISSQSRAWLHFACTSEDVNNVAYARMLKDLRAQIFLPRWAAIIEQIKGASLAYADLAMLSHTHGQTASPSTMGKEWALFGHRFYQSYVQLKDLPIKAKFNGAVGAFNAHSFAFPELDWASLTRDFLAETFGLQQNSLSTQIENHDNLVEYLDILKRFNTVAIGLCRDFWTYISMGYLVQNAKPEEVGSSTMPHKINPIDFENAEGNLGLSISLCQHFGEKLPISRLQRDLSDSTVLRNIGTLAGHSLLAYHSILRGLSRIAPHRELIAELLDQAHEVLAEPIQTVMRSRGVHDAYERLKDLTRGRKVTLELLHDFIQGCEALEAEDKKNLLELRPASYIGLAPMLARSHALSWVLHS